MGLRFGCPAESYNEAKSWGRTRGTVRRCLCLRLIPRRYITYISMFCSLTLLTKTINISLQKFNIFNITGASLDRKTGKLIESKPKVLYEQMPVIYIFAINTTAGKDPRLYECPIYRKPQRTDAKYVGSIDFETDSNPRHWTLRGVALLCDIK